MASCYQVNSGGYTLTDQFFSFIMGKHGKLPYERTVVSIITIPLNLDPPAALEIKLLIDEHSQGF